MVYRSASQTGDVGIVAESAPNAKILNNTVILSGTYPNAIEHRFPATTGVNIRNNLTDATIQARDGATATLANNVTNAQPAWFVNSSIGDLHLSSAATLAIDRAQVDPDVTLDYDGDSRPIGPLPDIGADEFGTSLVQPSPPTNLWVQ
jgi:hypothetical protein